MKKKNENINLGQYIKSLSKKQKRTAIIVIISVAVISVVLAVVTASLILA